MYLILVNKHFTMYYYIRGYTVTYLFACTSFNCSLDNSITGKNIPKHVFKTYGLVGCQRFY